MLFHSDNKYVGCDKCNWVGTPGSLDSHKDSAHKTYICDQCNVECRNKANLEQHMLRHRQYHCRICDISMIGNIKRWSNVLYLNYI